MLFEEFGKAEGTYDSDHAKTIFFYIDGLHEADGFICPMEL